MQLVEVHLALVMAGVVQGGRVSIHIDFANKFTGLITTGGGFGSGTYPAGASGTVYIQENNRGPQYAEIKYDAATNTYIKTATHKRVLVDNFDTDKELYANHGIPWIYTVIEEKQQAAYTYDELELRGHSNLQIGFKCDSGSETLFPEWTNMFGSRSFFAGLVTGIEKFMVRRGADVLFYSTGHTAKIENGQYITMTDPGNYEFPIFHVGRLSVAEFQHITTSMTLTSAEFLVKHQGLFYMNFANIFSSYAHVESEAILSMDERGNGPEKGYGKGTTKSGIGCGAGHGGWGGCPAPDYGGEPFNSVFSPGNGVLLATEEFSGSGGGNGGGQGGSGGGFLLWEIGDLLELNGVLSLNGADGVGGNAGGGSGGSVLIKTMNMSGHGAISVKGGNGVGSGGGGSGGRIGIHCQWRYQYGGAFDNYGGDGGASQKQAHTGAAGTSYREENLRELEYRLKKYDKVHNTTFMEVDHKNVTVIGHKFLGDKTGQLHTRSNQHVYVEYVESILNRTEAVCSFIIEQYSEIIFPEEVHVQGTNSTIAGEVTGVLDLNIERDAFVEFMSTANTANLKNGAKVNIQEPSYFSFGTVTVKQGGLVGFSKISDIMHLEAGKVEVRYQGELYMNDAELESGFAEIESQGTFHLNGHGNTPENGPGAGRTVGSVGCGASHGGYGGCSDQSQATHPYGSVYSPNELGSGGGNGQGTGGNGGGRLLWDVAVHFELNGMLALQGNDGQGSNAGGGSGGSLLVKTTNFTGHGEINVAGGNGVGSGAGAAGGRVGIHCQYRYTYGGKYTNHGGTGASSASGAPAGTTFVENNMRPLEYRILKYMPGTNTTYFQVDHRYLHMDNIGNLVPGATLVMENETITYEFDEVEVTGASIVQIYHPLDSEVTVTIHKGLGDKTGQIHMRENQTVLMEYVESESNVTEAPVSYYIDHGATIIMPTEVHMHGVRTNLLGLLVGVHHLYIEDNGAVSVFATAQTAQLSSGIRTDITTPGNFSLPSMKINSYGSIEFRHIANDLFNLDFGRVDLKYKGELLMNYGTLVAGNADIESESLFDLRGRGHPAQTGNGAVPSSTYGGSHGGVGGGQSGNTYGSVFTPKELGSGGGGSYGGSGGGFINFKIGSLLHVDGDVKANGATPTSGHSGGGSGGSIMVEAFNVSGHGLFDASGGDGYASGCGGGGGRIAMLVDAVNLYGGAYSAKGGSRGTSSSNVACDGGPGTIYKYESSRGPTYRELKYNPRLNVTTLKPEHSKLTVDNADLLTEQPAMVMENATVYYEFDEVQVEGHSYVHFYHPSNADNVTVIIKELTGNKQGFVRVQSKQQVIVDFVASTHTYLDAPCGFHVDTYGELVLPTEVYVTTDKVILGGTLIGVETLTIERNAELILQDDAHTRDIRSLQLSYLNTRGSSSYTPGDISIGTLSVNNLGKLTVSLDPLFPEIATGDLTIKNGGTVSLETLQVMLNSTNLIVENNGLITGSGFGFTKNTGTGAGTQGSYDGSGGGHASRGGTSESNAAGGAYYGEEMMTTDPGSGGGGSSGTAGGSHISINVGQAFSIEGTIESNGLDGTSTMYAGSGAGGSILITSNKLQGYGTISVNGGKSYEGYYSGNHSYYQNGAGSGGRIAVNLNELPNFRGSLVAQGGLASNGGSTNQHGGPGTVFIKSTIGDTVSRYLWIDNQNRGTLLSCSFPTYVNSTVLHTLYLQNRACVRLSQSNVLVSYLHGGSGLLYLENEVEMNQEERAHLKANLHVVAGSKAIMPPTLFVEETLTAEGGLIGVEHLYTRGVSNIIKTGYSICSTSITLNSEFNFYTVTVMDGGLLKLTDDDKTTASGLSFRAYHIHLEDSAKVEVEGGVEFIAGVFDMEKDSTLNGNEFGYEAGSGTGYGRTCGPGTGAGHGGIGGSASCGCSCSGSCVGGAAYSNACTPWLAGSGGGNSVSGTGGTGGSAIRVIASHAAFIEGAMSSNGGSGTNAAGGGSGGSIWIDSNIIEGWGSIDADGGSTGSYCQSSCWHGGCCCYHGGGGGAGGRIRTVTGNYTQKVLYYNRDSGGGGSGGVGSLCDHHDDQCSGHGNGSAGICTCDSGYYGNDCQYSCECGSHGTCNSDGICVCDHGYIGFHCESTCDDNTTCSGQGHCTTCGSCLCNACYHGSDCSSLCSGHGTCDADACLCDACHLGEYCESECNGHGSCNGTACICQSGWYGAKCTIKSCGGLNNIPCSGHGTCHAASQTCFCDPGWEGSECENPDCPGDINCNGRGTCNTAYEPPRCTDCDVGWMGPACDDPCVHGTPNADNTNCTCNSTCYHGLGCNIQCSEHGTCDVNYDCYCDPFSGWAGTLCEIPGCPRHPVTLEECSNHGTCNSFDHICECDAAWKGAACHIADCQGEPDCQGRGHCDDTLNTPRCINCTGPWMGVGCDEPCVNGTETPMNAGTCVCDTGFAGVGCDSECSGNGVITGGACVCDYVTGWKGPLCDIPGCPGLFNLDCSNRGTCNNALHLCDCKPGWMNIGCEDADCPGTPDCNRHGSCNSTLDPPECMCTSPYFGADCGLVCDHGTIFPTFSDNCTCDPGWVGIECDAECSLHGSFNGTMCNCDVNWRGVVCEMPGCPGIGEDCTGHGDCNTATHICTCNAGWTGSGCEVPDCPGSPDCMGRGTCDTNFDPPKCMNCEVGWMGPACDDPCVNGTQNPPNSGFCECDPCYFGKGCNSECAGNGQCVADVCECDTSWRGSLCEVPGCPGTKYDCSQHGECNSANHECTCFPGWTGAACDEADCPNNCTQNGICNTTDVVVPECVCYEDWMTFDCSKPCVHGNKTDNIRCTCDPCYTGAGCDLECSGKGVCDNGVCNCTRLPGNAYVGSLCEEKGCPGADGACNQQGSCNSVLQECTCFPGFKGYDCSEPSCPGTPECSDKGTCVAGTCMCDSDRIGDYCQLPCYNGTNINGECVCNKTCITGPFCHLECSGNGLCDTNGECVCDFNDGFKGDKCDKPGCPGWPENCMGHGSCNEVTGECQCDSNWKQPACAIPECPNDCNNDPDAQCLEPPGGGIPRCFNCSSNKMGDACEYDCFHGVGVRDANGNWECECDSCYSGTTCNLLCNGQGSCTGNGTCDCGFNGYRGSLCDTHGCPGYDVDCSGHGNCGGSHSCICDAGWTGIGCHKGACSNNCTGQGTCIDTLTLTTPYCSCDANYFGSACEYICTNGSMANGTCVCDPCFDGLECETECSNRGTCTNGICECVSSRGTYCETNGCPGLYNLDCSGHGSCNTATSSCTCNTGWIGTDCATPDCPSNCNNRGHCNTTYTVPVCTDCEKGWMGSACDIPCNGTQSPMDSGTCVCDSNCQHGTSCELTCSNVGSCVNETCVCTDSTGYSTGAWGTYCEEVDCPGRHMPCSGNELFCIKTLPTPMCICKAGFFGLGCQNVDCPGQPDCSNQGVCQSDATCLCNNMTMGLQCELPCEMGTAAQSGNMFSCECDDCISGTGCDSVCNGHGTCNGTGTCICDSAWWGALCTDPGCPGVGSSCSGHGNCLAGSCSCDQYYKGAGCEEVYCTDDCNNRGTCDYNNYWPPKCINCNDSIGPKCEKDCIHGTELSPFSTVCVCDDCYSGFDCSIQCSNQGLCNSTSNSCDCETGFKGSICADLDCPGEPDCSNYGTCMRSNNESICSCNAGFTGADCSDFICPGTPTCSGNGACILATGSVAPSCACNHGFGSLDCSSCLQHFASPNCDKCEADYIGYNTTCGTLCKHGYATVTGGDVCQCYDDDVNGHWTGQACDVCQDGWALPSCTSCSLNYVGPGHCSITCVTGQGVYADKYDGTNITTGVQPVFNCYTLENNGQKTAWFGYINPNMHNVYITSDTENYLMKSDMTKYQPLTMFKANTVADYIYSEGPFNASDVLTWNLRTTQANTGASLNVPLSAAAVCPFTPSQPIFTDTTGYCKCVEGYWGPSCEYECPGGGSYSCFGKGQCNATTGECTCVIGAQASTNCSVCHTGWTGDDCSIAVFAGSTTSSNISIFYESGGVKTFDGSLITVQSPGEYILAQGTLTGTGENLEVTRCNITWHIRYNIHIDGKCIRGNRHTSGRRR
ncbi:uncharacterized protein LOC117331103 [Pecten maximus]|uniref:uncharacterized protein LOC117331103 n=1 Tax=Pecten maximus TaxID=6579 RepID=UPI0014585375|nr:uncharacterized protein LOC117331103 [Pecten maximus]